MKITIDFDVDKARKVLVKAATSVEEGEKVIAMSDDEIKNLMLNVVLEGYGIKEVTE